MNIKKARLHARFVQTNSLTNEKADRKLQYFANALKIEVEAKKRHIKNEAMINQQRYMSENIESASRRIKVMLQAKQDEIKRNANRQISKAKVNDMAKYVQLRKDQIDKLFVSVQAKLARFTQNEEYTAYLIQRIQQIQNSGSFPVFSIIKLSPFDMRLEDTIKTKTRLAPEAGSHDYIGGFILLDTNRGVRADYTFKTLLAQTKKEFRYDLTIQT